MLARTVVGPVSASLVEAFGLNTGLSTSSGRGGKFFEEMSAQYNSLSAMRDDVNHIADAFDQVALSLEKLDLIEKKKLETIDELKSEHLQQILADAAQIASEVGQALNIVDAASGLGATSVAHFVSAGLVAEKILQSWTTLHKQIEVAKLSGEIGTVDAVKLALGELAQARDGTADLPRQITAFAVASSNLRTIQKQADFYRAQVDLADFAGDDLNDPQFVNIAMRRIYSTNLAQYEAALQRARQLAFIARRAIELRFGVDWSG